MTLALTQTQNPNQIATVCAYVPSPTPGAEPHGVSRHHSSGTCTLAMVLSINPAHLVELDRKRSQRVKAVSM